MPLSKPVFQDIVVYNPTTLKHAGLFFRYGENDINGSDVMQWYYMETDASGRITNTRENALNDYFTDINDAIATPPSGYGDVPAGDNFQNENTVAYLQQYPTAEGRTTTSPSIVRTKQEYLQAVNNGATEIMIWVEWGLIYNDYAAQVTNSDSNWAYIFDLADYAIGLNAKVKLSFRICTDLNNSQTYGAANFVNGSDKIDLWANVMQDDQGYPARIEYGSGHVSLAYEPGVTMALDFVKKALVKLTVRYGSKFVMYSVAMTAQKEAGYNFENQQYTRTQRAGTVSISGGGTTLTGSGTNFTTDFQVGHPVFFPDKEFVRVTAIASNTSMTVTSPLYSYSNSIYYSQGDVKSERYQTSYDFSPPAVAAFKTAMQAKYTLIATLNTSWGTSYGSFSEVEPPRSGQLYTNSTPEVASSIYSNNRGKDWWQFNFNLFKGYMEDCRQLGVDYAPQAKFALEFGAITYPYSDRRMTVLASEWDDSADMVKAQMGISSSRPDYSISVDVMRTNITKKKGTEINDFDMREIYGATNPTDIETYGKEIAYSAIDNGAKYILIISDSINSNYFSAMMNVLKGVVQKFAQPPNTVNVEKTVNQSIGKVLENPNSILADWKSVGAGNSVRASVPVSDDYGFTASSGCQYPLSLYTLHSFCLKDNSIKSFPYTNADGSTNSANFPTYQSTKVRILAPTHSITYTGSSGNLAMVKWRLVGQDGITYISNTQTAGWYYVMPDVNGNQPAQNNNHPDRRYIKTSAEDAIYYLPIQSYTIYMTNLTAFAVTFQVDFLNPSTMPFRKKLTSAMGEQSYTFSTSGIPYNELRQVKINCNRYEQTDSTWADIP